MHLTQPLPPKIRVSAAQDLPGQLQEHTILSVVQGIVSDQCGPNKAREIGDHQWANVYLPVELGGSRV